MPRAVMLTALSVEYSAVQTHLTDLREEMHSQGTIYERGKFSANGQEWEVGIAQVGAGNTGAAVEAERAIAYFKPDILLFVGIAGGIKDVAIGDVVAATKVYGYESGKVGEQFFTRPAVGQSAYALVQRASAEAKKGEWLKRLSNCPDPEPRVFVAPISAGEKVFASKESDLFQFLRTSYNDAIAVEMEGFGFLSAAFAYPNMKAIVIRGISDLLEGKNDDSVESEHLRQERAAYHASAFAFEILAQSSVGKRRRKRDDLDMISRNPSLPPLESVDFSEQLDLSDLSEITTKIHQAPENITDPAWQNWFSTMFELQFKALKKISFRIGKLLKAHRTTVYFVDDSEKSKNQKELWSLFAQGDTSLEIRVSFGDGISGRVAETKQISFVPYDAYEHINSEEIKNQDSKTGYRTYTLMTLPLLNNRGDLVAVFQFVNKLIEVNLEDSINTESSVTQNNIDRNGFTKDDQKKFEKHIAEIRAAIDLYQQYYNLAKKWQSIIDFSSATLILSKQGQNLEDILSLIINEAKKIANADEGTFWLLDGKGKKLQAKILNKQEGIYKIISVEVGQGFAGEVARDRSILNIPYDLYDDPRSAKSKETDQETGYRTCSLLCMPVFGSNSELIGVTQLLNKRRRQSKHQEYNSKDYPTGEVPDFFKASFSTEDEERLRKFNEQVAAAIQNAQRSVMIEQYNNLYNLLNITAQLAGGYLNAHRAKIYLVDEETKFGRDKQPKELWSILSKPGGEEPCEISIPISSEKYVDLPGQVAQEYINTYKDIEGEISRSENYFGGNPLIDAYLRSSAQNTEDTDYKIYNRLVLSLSRKMERSNSLVAVVEFINKLNPGISQDNTLSEDIINKEGFNEDDKEIFVYGYTASLIRLIEAFLDIYKPVRQYLDSEKLIRARESIFKDNLGIEISYEKKIKTMEEKVKDAAKQIVSAHGCTLWRVDPKDKTVLFADIPNDKGDFKKVKIVIGSGYVGDAAQRAINAIQVKKNGEKNSDKNLQDQDRSLNNFLNIPFDVYSDNKRSHMAKQTDKNTGYRTCSILCMPILSSDGTELLGIVQLVNKVRRGFENDVNTISFENKYIAPACFMASFTKRDERQISSFNDAVGNILQFLDAPDEIDQLTEAYREKISSTKNQD